MPRQKKGMEYVKKDAIAHIMAKMSRWNITIADLIAEYYHIMGKRKEK